MGQKAFNYIELPSFYCDSLDLAYRLLRDNEKDKLSP